MSDELTSIFSNVLVHNPSTNQKQIQMIEKMYENPQTFAVLVDILQNNKLSEVRSLAAIGINKTIQKSWRLFNNDDIQTIKSTLLSLFILIKERVVQSFLLESISFVFKSCNADWPEIIKIIQNYHNQSEVITTKLALQLLSCIADSIEFDETCISLIFQAFDFNDQGLINLSIETMCKTPSFSQDFIPLFERILSHIRSLMVNEDNDIISILNKLSSLFMHVPAVFPSLFQLIMDEEIPISMKFHLFIPISSMIKANPEIYQNDFSQVLTVAIQLCQLVFDDDCYLQNHAFSVDFSFLKAFVTNLDETVFYSHLNDSSPSFLFASLCAIHPILKHLSYKPRCVQLFEFLLNSAKSLNHAVCELSLDLLTDFMCYSEIDLSQFSDDFVQMILGCNNIDDLLLQELAMKCLTRFLFCYEINTSLIEVIVEMLLTTVQNGSTPVVDFSIFAFAALAERCRKKMEPYTEIIVSIVWQYATTYNPQNPTSQPKAIETLVYYLVFVPSSFGSNIEDIMNLLIHALQSESRQLYISSCDSLRLLAKHRIDYLYQYLSHILEIVTKCLFIDSSYKSSIDESGCLLDELHIQSLKFLKYIIQNYEIDDLISMNQLLLTYLPESFEWETERLAFKDSCLFIVKYPGNGGELFQMICGFVQKDPSLVFSSLSFIVQEVDCFQFPLNDSFQYIEIPECFDYINSCIGRFDFPIQEFISLLDKEENSSMKISLYVGVICTLNEKIIIEHDLLNLLMAYGLNTIQLCNFEIPPHPIRFLGDLLKMRYEFDAESIQSFVTYLNQLCEVESEAEFYEETIQECSKVILIIISLKKQYWEHLSQVLDKVKSSDDVVSALLAIVVSAESVSCHYQIYNVFNEYLQSSNNNDTLSNKVQRMVNQLVKCHSDWQQ